MLETICDLMKDAYRRNWITSRDGNISIRQHDRDHYYVTPSGVRKQDISPDHFKKIGFKDDGMWKILSHTDLSDRLKPTGEIYLHHGLLRKLGQHQRHQRVVVHLHPTYIIAAMHAGIELNKLVESFPELSRYTRVAPNVGDIPPLTHELAYSTHQNLELNEDGYINYDIVGLKGHGCVSVGETPHSAYEHIERLEHICKIVLASNKY